MAEILKDAVKHNWGFWILAGIATALLVASFLLPPSGQIHPSVIAGAGEIFAFASLWTVIHAIDRGNSAKVSKGDVSVEIKKED